MSTTSSPACPARSLSLVLNEEEAELQAYLAAAQREAQEKWKRLRKEKALGGGACERKIVEEKGVVEEHVDDVVEEETEVIPKVEPRPRKVVPKMVAGLPRSREVIPMILIPKKRCNVVEVEVVESSRKRRKVVQSPVVVDSDSDSIPVPFPRPCERCVRGDQLLVPPEVEVIAGLIPAQ
ncbi:hypothetical protein GGU11DRAFT_750821 [Lentinula aff. detonsa]|nr:hypothetical protein GGU11DRAFT_750821 [Lentinula aff. detonsa]